MARRVVVIDNYDSFTYNLVQYLSILGAECVVARNDKITPEGVAGLAPAALLLSPGPCGPPDAGVTLDVLQAFAGRVPILGVCLGHQAIATHFGATVVRASQPVHGKVSPIRHDTRGLFRGLPNPLVVARYHSLVVDEATLTQGLEPTAHSADGALMGIRHPALRIEGVQFHPESFLTEHGLALLRNWLEDVVPSTGATERSP